MIRSSINGQLALWLGLLVLFAGGLWLLFKQQPGVAVVVRGVASVGTQQPVTAGDRISEGTTVQTGDQAVALEFVDGARLQVAPNSSVLIAEYRYRGAGSSSVLRLIRGGLRTVTGAIADLAPDNYRVETSVATVGVRGTEFSLDWCPEPCARRAPGLLAKVHSGMIAVANDAGELVLRDGDAARVTARDVAPRAEEAASLTIVPPITP